MVLLSNLVAAAAIFSSANAIPSYGSCPASDKCLKAVKANSYATKDCKAAFHKTVTSGKPCTTTVFAKSISTVTKTKTSINTITSTVTTVTVTPTKTVTARDIDAQIEKRGPPGYAAQPCSTVGQYKSACSCLGVQPTTKTVAPSTKTITKTRTSTKTITIASTTTLLATATATSTTNPDDELPPLTGCRDAQGRAAKFEQVGTEPGYRRFLNIDENGFATITRSFSEANILALTRSGLLREAFGAQPAFKTTDDEELSFLFTSEDITGPVLRCELSNGYTSGSVLTCAQGDKAQFYVCPDPSGEGASRVAIGTVDSTTAVGLLGCEAVGFEAGGLCEQ